MRRSSWLAFLPLLAFVVLVLALITALQHNNADGNKFALHVDEPAPLTDLPAVDKDQPGFTTHDRLGHPYMVNFFASWCVPCHAEHEALLDLVHRFHVPIIGISYKDTPSKTQSFLVKNGNPFLVVAIDTAGRTGIDWGITGVPETFVIDAQGIIRLHLVGPLTDESIDHQLLPLWDKITR